MDLLRKNAGSLEYIPELLASDAGISQAFGFANEAGMSREELEIQFKRRDFIILQRGSLILAESKGREEGIEIGIEKGRQDEQRKIILTLLNKGSDIAFIADTLSLSIDTVKILST